MSATFHPIMKWSQTKSDVSIVVDARDIKNEKIDIEEKKLRVEYHESDKHYLQEFELNTEVDKEKSKIHKTPFCITITLSKKKEEFWKHLSTNDKMIKNLQVD